MGLKSSISAVEGYLKGYLMESGKKLSTLSDCIKELKKVKICPKNILNSLEQLYIYRNRMKNLVNEAPNYDDLTKDDARLCNQIAVSFINYFFRRL